VTASARRGPGSIRSRGRGLILPAVVALLVAGLTGCTQAAPAAPAAEHAPGAGSYPVATAGANVRALQEVSTGGYRLVAAGDPVRVHLGGTTALITVAGPDVAVPVPKPGEPISAATAPGVLTVTVVVSTGAVHASASTFLGLDQKALPIRLTPDASAIEATPGHPATLHLRSRFGTGHTTLTWQPTGKPLITWDFTVEID
jgi:hypothetical protein